MFSPTVTTFWDQSFARGSVVADDGAVSRDGIEHLHYFTDAAKRDLQAGATDGRVRALTAADADLFAAFTSACSEEDVDEAYVELDHWEVVGVITGGVLVAAASAYPWKDSRLADIGVITHPDHRGRGYARAVVRAISRRVLERGHEPQYRCDHANAASAAVAVSAGMSRFGSRDVAAGPAE